MDGRGSFWNYPSTYHTLPRGSPQNVPSSLIIIHPHVVIASVKKFTKQKPERIAFLFL